MANVKGGHDPAPSGHKAPSADVSSSQASRASQALQGSQRAQQAAGLTHARAAADTALAQDQLDQVMEGRSGGAGSITQALEPGKGHTRPLPQQLSGEDGQRGEGLTFNKPFGSEPGTYDTATGIMPTAAERNIEARKDIAAGEPGAPEEVGPNPGAATPRAAAATPSSVPASDAKA